MPLGYLEVVGQEAVGLARWDGIAEFLNGCLHIFCVGWWQGSQGCLEGSDSGEDFGTQLFCRHADILAGLFGW